MASLPVAVAQRAAATRTSKGLPSPNTIAHNKLQQSVGQLSSDLFSDTYTWEAVIELPFVPHYSNSSTTIDLSKAFDSIEPSNIYSYISKSGDSCQPDSNEPVDRLYLNPKMFPPIFRNGDDLSKEESKTIEEITAFLKSAAHDSGSAVRKRSSCLKSMSKFRIIFECACNHTKKKKKNGADDTTEEEKQYRESHHVKNKNGTAKREGAQRGAPGLPRRRNKKPNHKCPQAFTLKVDSIGFYISTLGSSLHEGHPRYNASFTHAHISSLTQEEREDAVHAAKATVNKAAARNFVQQKWNKHITRSQVTLLDTLAKDDEVDDIGALLHLLETCPTVRWDMLWSKEKEVVSPLSTQSGELDVFSSSKVDGEVTEESLLGSDSVMKEVAATAIEDRKSRGIAINEQVFHSIAWSDERTLRYFQLCPQAITCDITSHTNNAGFHLLTFSCKTSIDKQVVFLRIWIPDQRRVSFRYVFQRSLPKLLPEHARMRVCYIMKDGDPNQADELRKAMKEFFPKAIDAGCGFHIVEKGWNRHVPPAGVLRPRSKKRFLAESRKIHTWLYSFMRPGYCQSKEEYELSKYLLLKYVTSNHFLRVVGGENYEYMIRAIVKYIRSYVFPYEQMYAAHLRKDVMHFDISHSSAHEGTNFGLKAHAASARPNQGLHQAAAAMGIQDTCKSAECNLIIGNDMRYKDKSEWTSNPFASEMLSFSAALLEYWFKKSKDYLVRRVGWNKFLVVYCGDGCDPEFVAKYIDGWTPPESHGKADDKDSFPLGEEDAFEMSSNCKHPLFSHAYIVTLDANCCRCSCCHFERVGLPCPHFHACFREVLNAVGIEFKGFNISSVSIRWTTAFMYYGYRDVDKPKEKELVKKMARLAMHDTKGPKFTHTLPDESVMPILPDIPELPLADRLKNYPKEAIPNNFSEMFDSLMSYTHIPPKSQQLEEEWFGADSSSDNDEDEEEEEELSATITTLRSQRSDALEDHFGMGGGLQKDDPIPKRSAIRSRLVSRMDEAATLLQQIGDEQLVEEFGNKLDSLINNLHKRAREEGRNESTSPTEQGANKKQKMTSITSVRDTSGKSRVYCAENGRR